MCGILGYIRFSQSDGLGKEGFLAALKTLGNRGPDDIGILDLDGFGFLGHTRLSILDLDARASQPFGNGRYSIIYNGEVYNYLELRDELTTKGYTFSTTSDTEVVLNAFLEWGEACQERFNGMWAFAIWDRMEKRLFFSRDRFGIKPLYVHCSSGKLIFGSELKALVGLIEDVRFDDMAIASWLSYGDRFESISKTIVKSIEKIMPGECGYFSVQGISKNKWWNTLTAAQQFVGNMVSPIDELQELFIDACKLRMRSDVPLGAALSGGIDSSSVVSVMARKRSSQKFCSFIAHYPNSEQDELPYARAVVEKYNIDCQIITSNMEKCLSSIDEVIYAAEDGVNLPTGPYLLYRSYKEHGIKISIDGHGADELFGGYIEYPMLSLSKRAAKLPLADWGRSLRVLNGMSQRSPLSLALRKIFRRTAPASLPEVIPFPGEYHAVCAVPEIDKLDPITQKLYMDFHHWTMPAILRRFDRCSMAHSVEVRSPFLDWRIVAFAHALPLKYKLGHGVNKYIVREMAREYLPRSIYRRKKKLGFTNPNADWFGQKKLKSYMLDASSSRAFLESRAFDGKQCKAMIEHACSINDVDALQRLWPFLQISRLQELLAGQREQVIVWQASKLS